MLKFRNHETKSSDQSNHSSISSFMYLFLLGFALITLLAACGLDEEEHIHSVGSETWETTESIEILPSFLENHTQLSNELYAQVAAHAHILNELDCYCGCMVGTELDEAHQNLLRCYWAEHPADDGSVTWTDHSTTCGICKHELEMVIQLSGEGKTTEQIKQAVELQYKPS